MPLKLQPLAQQMRALEYFHGLTVLPHTWPVVRVDGRSFSRLTAARIATRRRVGVVDPLPTKDEYDALLREILVSRSGLAQRSAQVALVVRQSGST